MACGKPTALTPLYTYITEEDPEHRGLSYEDEKLLKARLGDLLMKEWTLVGIPVVVVALISLAKAEKNVKEEDLKLPEKRLVFAPVVGFAAVDSIQEKRRHRRCHG